MKAELEKAVKIAAGIIGDKAESYAKKLCPVDTGALRNSITHEVEDGKTVKVGSAINYAPYVELGTGPHYEAPPGWMENNGKRGRGLDHWRYQDAFGEWHTGYPQYPRPYIRPALEDHTEEYKEIFRKELEGGAI